jgi:hypothetical protein
MMDRVELPVQRLQFKDVDMSLDVDDDDDDMDPFDEIRKINSELRPVTSVSASSGASITSRSEISTIAPTAIGG